MRLGRPTSVYIDTNAFIRSVEGDETAFLFLVENAGADLLRLFTSEFTLAEVLVGPLKAGDGRLVKVYEDLLSSDDVLEVVPVERQILRSSAEIQAALGNKPPDSLHVATAVACECRVFVSSDRRIRLPNGMVRVSSSEVVAFEGWP